MTLKPGLRFWNKPYGHHFDAVIWRNYSSVNKAKYLWKSISQAGFLLCLELIISFISELERRERTCFELQKLLIIRNRLWTEGSLSFKKCAILISVLREAQKVHFALSFFSLPVLVFQLLMRKTSLSQEMAVTRKAAAWTTAMSEPMCTEHSFRAGWHIIYFPMENESKF